jgi:alpha-galactosidase
MKTRAPLNILALLCILSPQLARAVSPTPAETAEARRWAAAKFEGVANAKQHDGLQAEPQPSVAPPFSFVYQGKQSADFLKNWRTERVSKTLNDGRTARTTTYSDPATGLEVRCDAVEYREYPACEWILRFKNTGAKDTGIIENILPMDLSLTSASSEFVVHHARGSRFNIVDFQPIDDVLAANAKLQIESSPWPSTTALPFFNVEAGGHGIIAGIGWTEGWAANFHRDAGKSLSVKVGPSLGHFVLHPGEEVRSLRMLVLFWKDDRIHGHNLWRQLLLKHYSPTPGGKPLQAPLCHANWGWWNTQQQIARASWWKKHNLPMELYWMDIGWERDPTAAEAKAHLATCVVDEKKHPDGLKPISDACHKLGMKYLLWFGTGRLWPSVERVQKFRPELLSAEYRGADSGNPMINKYMIEHFANKFADWGVDVFRPDAHSTTVPDSAPNRQGINQARSAAGFIEFWDALLKRSPNMFIDNCCAGGENVDLETIKRSIALWRSDYQVNQNFDPIGLQGQTYGLSFWVPLSAGVIGDACREAGVAKQPDAYSIRSAYSPAMVVTWFGNDQTMPGDNFDYNSARRLLNEYLSVRKYFSGDYYPLTQYNLDDKQWLAWQFDRPDLGEGLVQVFRRGKSLDETGKFRLRGLERDAVYTLTNPDVAGTTEMSGRELLDNGLPIAIKNRPGAGVVIYKKKPQGSNL